MSCYLMEYDTISPAMNSLVRIESAGMPHEYNTRDVRIIIQGSFLRALREIYLSFRPCNYYGARLLVTVVL